MGNRKIRIAFMVLITVAMFMGITLFANIGFATSDLMEPRLQGSSNAFDESLYFSAVQLYQRTNANGEDFNAPSANVSVSSDGDTVTIDAKGFDHIGDKLVIKCTITNYHPDLAAQLEARVSQCSRTDLFDIAINRTCDTAVHSNGGTQDVFVSIVLKDCVSEAVVVPFSINIHAIAA